LCFWIVRRFVPGPRTAAAIVLGTALLSNVYEMTYCFHSDPLFCVLSAAAFLLALQIREGRGGIWRIVLLLLLCGASVFIRWAGPFNWPIIAGILLTGIRRPLAISNRFTPLAISNRFTLTAVLTCLVYVVTFLCLFSAIKLTKAEQEAARKSGLFLEDSVRAESQTYNLVSGARLKGSATPTVLLRMENIGHWLSWFFYEPLRMAGLKAEIVSAPLGWLGIVLIGIQVKRGIARQQWIWLGLAAPCAVFFAFWPNATVRYLLPFFMFLLIAMGQPLILAAQKRGWMGTLCRTALIGFIGSCVLCNAALYGVEAWVFRHADFYGTYYCGMHKSLIAAGRCLRDLGAGDQQIAVNPHYDNMGRLHSSRFGMRGLALMTDRSILLMPDALANDNLCSPPAQPLIDWAKQRHAKYYVCQTPISPWRWQFSMGWLQQRMEKKPVVATPSDWEVWDISGEQAMRISLPSVDDWPTHVPGGS
jgi:hypothetical protein